MLNSRGKRESPLRVASRRSRQGQRKEEEGKEEEGGGEEGVDSACQDVGRGSLHTAAAAAAAAAAAGAGGTAAAADIAAAAADGSPAAAGMGTLVADGAVGGAAAVVVHTLLAGALARTQGSSLAFAEGGSDHSWRQQRWQGQSRS